MSQGALIYLHVSIYTSSQAFILRPLHSCLVFVSFQTYGRDILLCVAKPKLFHLHFRVILILFSQLFLKNDYDAALEELWNTDTNSTLRGSSVGSVGSVILYQVSSALSVTVKSVILLIYKSMTDKKTTKKIILSWKINQSNVDFLSLVANKDFLFSSPSPSHLSKE